jgi:hypothetical protein
MYATVDADHVMVFRREYGEAGPGIPAYSLFMTIPAHRTANKALQATAAAPSVLTEP